MHRPVALLLPVVLASLSAIAFAAPPESVPLKARPFALDQVRLLGGPFNDAMDRDLRYLKDLDSDRLLHDFRVTAGLPAPGDPYGGWERTELRGHTMGHYLSACARMIAATGDEEIRAKADRIVAELGKCQQALGPNGYLSAFPESFFDRVETLQPVWAPYYTMHKIMAGLLDMHVIAKSDQALEVVTGIAAWCKGRCDKLSDDQMQAMLNHTEQGGMNEVLANLYGVTGNADHVALSRRFVQRSYNGPLAAGRDELMGQHVNSFIPNMTGTARQYELTGNREDHDVADFFWHQVTGHRCYCTGGTSNHEHWRTEPDVLAAELGDHTQETCCTYNMLKLTRHLFCWDPRPEYADYYERALLNSILSTQDPKTGMMMYFVPLGPGRCKTFNVPYDAFWCCTGTGMENHARYGEAIYFHGDDELYVNLFIASELDWKARGVRIRQETAFPEKPSTTLTVRTDGPAEFTLNLRLPGWSKRNVVRVNGEPVSGDGETPGYLPIHRTWQDGDRVELEMTMDLHVWPMPDDPTVAAVMFGPLVMAGDLGGEGLTDEMIYTDVNWYKFPPDRIAHPPDLLVPCESPGEWLDPVPGKPLTFRTNCLEENVTLVPYHRLFGRRYAVYWRLYVEGSPEHRKALAEEAARQARLARTLDRVAIGDADSEKSHGLKGEGTRTGQFMGRHWRDAAPGGWFSYEIKVPPEGTATLAVTYWGSDAGARTFDLLVDGRKIATVTLLRNKPHEFYDVNYTLPPELTRGKEKVTIKFQGHPDHMAGGVFGLAVLKPEKP